jgi:hypothetical protein
LKASEPELKDQERVLDCWVAERMGVGESESIPSRVASEGAAGSTLLEVPETARVLVVLTLSVRSMSETVRVPEVERAALVSVRNPVLELPVPTVMVGASLTAVIEVSRDTVVDE